MRLPRRDEDGAVLVLVLVVVLVISLGLLALADLTTTNVKVTTALRAQGGEAYAADAAIDSAVTSLRDNLLLGRDPGPPTNGGACADYIVPAGTYNGLSSVRVTCDPMPHSGEPTAGGGGGSNEPDVALLGTSTTETALSVGGNTNNLPNPLGLQIDGPIQSNSPRTVAQGGSISVSPGARLSATAGYTISAAGRCAGQAASYAPPCLENQPPHPDLDADSGWQPVPLPAGISEIPSASLTPAVACAGATVELPSGIYRDAAALSVLTNGNGVANACTGKVIHLRPGPHYYDFSGPTTTWTFGQKDVDVVGGVLLSQTPTTLGSGCDPAQSGVQMIFGGVSQLSITAGTLEVCPIISGNTQQIAVYGLRHTLGGATTTLSNKQPQSHSTVGSYAFSPEDDARLIDGNFAKFTADGTNHNPGVQLGNFNFPAIPADATITSVSLDVKYQAPTTGVQDLKLIVQPQGGAASTFNSGGNNCSPATEMCVDGLVHTTTISNISGFSDAASLTGMNVQFIADMKNSNGASGDARIDGVSVTASYSTVAVQAQSGCVVTSGGCDFLFADGNQTHLQLHGTLYAWNAKVSLNVPNQFAGILKRGAVVRVLNLNVPNSFAQSEPVISLPHQIQQNGPPLNRVIVLTAYVDGVARVRAQVTFVDVAGVNTAVTVDHWSTLR